MDTVDLIQYLIQYGIAGIALYMLWVIANQKLDRIYEELKALREEIINLRVVMLESRRDQEKA